MPKLEGKSGKSADSAIKLFGRTIPVKILSDNCISVNENSAENDKANEEKVANKRPTALVPCPRCESMDTKFCYFNNYNVNQPRHYCRKCQRYWTAGGALRNVPVGAGRRKNKPCLALHQRQFIEVSENVWNDRQAYIPLCASGNPDKLMKVGSIYQELGNIGEALKETVALHKAGKAESQPQIHDYSDSFTLDFSSKKLAKEGYLGSGKHVRVDLGGIGLADKCTQLRKWLEGVEKPSYSISSTSDKTQMSASKGESSASEVAQPVDDVASDSSLAYADPKLEPQTMSPIGFSSSSSCSMNSIGKPWPVYYNGCWSSIGVQSKTDGVIWHPPGKGILPSFNWPVPCGSEWGKEWGLSWRPANSDSEQKTLGKHERDEVPSQSKSDRSLWVHKTQRINDPVAALTSSSFVENLELENKEGSINSGGIFKALQPKTAKIDSAEAHPVQILSANSAALSSR